MKYVDLLITVLCVVVANIVFEFTNKEDRGRLFSDYDCELLFLLILLSDSVGTVVGAYADIIGILSESKGLRM